MSENADLVVLSYLARVSDSAHAQLTSDQRVRFVARLRADIEVARRGANTPAKVRSVLDGFGTPESLVEEELRRLGRDDPTPPAPVEVTPAPGPQDGTVEVTAFRRIAQPASKQRRRFTAGVAELGPSPPREDVVRSRWSAVLAVAVCGVGGLLFPLVWLAGAGLALWTRAWERMDQVVGLGLPVLIALGAGIADHYASPGGSLWHALDSTGLVVFRFVSLAGAAYLGWRLFNATGLTASPPSARPTPWRAGPSRR